MMEEKRGLLPVILSWIHDVLLFDGLYMVLAGFIGMEIREAQFYAVKGFFLIIPVIISWILIRKLKVLLAYVISGAAVTFIMGAVFNSVLTGVLTALIFIIRGYVKIKKAQLKKEMQDMPGETAANMDMEAWQIPTILDKPHPWHWILFGAVYITGILAQTEYIWHWEFYLFVAEIFVCFAFCYIDRMWEFLKERRKIANMPVNMMKRVSRIIFGISALALVVFILPSVLYEKDILSDLVGMFYNAQANGEIGPMEFENLGGGGFEPFYAGELEEKEPPVWLVFLGRAVAFLVVAAVIVVLLRIIYKISRNSIRSFGEDGEDEVIFLKKSEEEERRRLGGRKKEKGSEMLSVNMRIRRKYKKIIRKSSKERPKGWETPYELETGAQLQEDESMKVLHKVYEKARYSKDGCTKEEAREV